jgi:hypothetical protein
MTRGLKQQRTYLHLQKVMARNITPEGREAMREGGKTSAYRLSPMQRQQRGVQNGTTTLLRYGIGHFSAMASLRWKKQKSKQ